MYCAIFCASRTLLVGSGNKAGCHGGKNGGLLEGWGYGGKNGGLPGRGWVLDPCLGIGVLLRV